MFAFFAVLVIVVAVKFCNLYSFLTFSHDFPFSNFFLTLPSIA